MWEALKHNPGGLVLGLTLMIGAIAYMLYIAFDLLFGNKPS